MTIICVNFLLVPLRLDAYVQIDIVISMQHLKKISLLSASAALATGGLIAASISIAPHSAKAAPEAYEVNESTLSGDQRNTDFINRVGAKQLLNDLRRGGYVVYVRHAKTFKDWGDQVSPQLNLADCSTQRRLSAEGKQQAREIGRGVKAAGIPVGQVFSSEYCRAYNTADLAFGKYKKHSNLNFLPCVDCTAEDYSEYGRRVSPLLSSVPASGTNTFLVGHDDPFQGVTMGVVPPDGIYPDPMGVAYVVKPMGNGKFELLAKILPTQWRTLARF